MFIHSAELPHQLTQLPYLTQLTWLAGRNIIHEMLLPKVTKLMVHTSCALVWQICPKVTHLTLLGGGYDIEQALVNDIQSNKYLLELKHLTLNFESSELENVCKSFNITFEFITFTHIN